MYLLVTVLTLVNVLSLHEFCFCQRLIEFTEYGTQKFCILGSFLEREKHRKGERDRERQRERGGRERRERERGKRE